MVAADKGGAMQERQIKAMGLFLLGGALIVAMSAIIRHFSAALPVGQIIFWRSSAALLPILAYMALRREFPAALRTGRPGRHLLRVTLALGAMACSFAALAHLSVALVTAIGFLAPVLTLPLAALLLGDRLTAPRLMATGLGLAGVAMMLWQALTLPGDGALLGVLLALGFALLMAVIRVVIKDLSRTERASTITIYFALAGTVAGALSGLWGWVPLAPADLALLALAGLIGGLAHICGAEAVAGAPLSVLMPLQYCELIWAALIDILIFATWPGLWGLAGMGIITMAGLLVWAERRRGIRDMP